MIRIIIADDHFVVCRGLRQIIDDEIDMTVVGEAHNAEEMLALVRTQACDVVVTDISMPGRTGLDALEELKRDRPALPFLVLSMHSEDQYALGAIRLGASGYLTKESAAEELVQAIRTIVAGEMYVRPSKAAKLVSDLANHAGRARHLALSERERQILFMIAAGKSARGIAQELMLSLRTIRTYRARILKKMAMSNTAELIHYAISHRLVGEFLQKSDSLPTAEPT